MQRADHHAAVDQTVGQRPATVRADGVQRAQRPVPQPEDGHLLAVNGQAATLADRDVVDVHARPTWGRAVSGRAVRNWPGVTGFAPSVHGST